MTAFRPAMNETLMRHLPEVPFTAAFDREVRVSRDRQCITHRAMAWSMDYTPDELLRWIAFYERMAQQPGTVRAPADVEVLHKARDLLAQEGPQP